MHRQSLLEGVKNDKKDKTITECILMMTDKRELLLVGDLSVAYVNGKKS